MRRGYVDTPEGQLHYLAEGKGEPLVLLHQGPRSSRMYVNLIPLLSKDYSVIAIDMIGYGGSDRLPPEGADVTYVSQNVVHVFDAFGLERTHLFGLHTGAAMAAEVAARAPTMVATLCLFGFPYMISEEERTSHLAKRSSGGSLFGSLSTSHDGTHLGRIWMRAYSEIGRMWLHTANAPSEKLYPNPGESVHTFMTPADLEFMESWVLDWLQISKNLSTVYKSIFTHDFTSRLPLIQAPTLHIEPDSPYENYFCRRGNMVKEIIPNCEAAVLPGSDDNAAQFKAPELAEMMLGFLRKHPL